jgi:hypothetical protein
MNTRTLLRLLLLVVVVCFALGLLSVFLRQSNSGTSGGLLVASGPISAPTGVSPDTAQTNILILGVDSLGAPTMTLRAVWFASFRLPGRDVFLCGVPSNLAVGGRASQRLDAAFGWDPQAGVAPRFLKLLLEAAPLQPSAIIVLDETAFAALVDYMGGVDLNGATFSGNQVLGVLGLVNEQPDAALATQARLVEEIGNRLPSLGSSPDLTPLRGLLPDHVFLSIPEADLQNLLQPLLPIEPGSVIVTASTGQP